MELNTLFDGIVSSVLRQSKPQNSCQWIVFDGPMYSDWAENLNTVLDDSNLCLSTGEVLQLMDNTSLIFEVDDLKNASPSTVRINSSLDFQKLHRFLFRFRELVSFISKQIPWIGNPWQNHGWKPAEAVGLLNANHFCGIYSNGFCHRFVDKL